MAEVLRGSGIVKVPSAVRVGSCCRSKSAAVGVCSGGVGKGEGVKGVLLHSAFKGEHVCAFSNGELQSSWLNWWQSKKMQGSLKLAMQVRASQTLFVPRTMRWWDKGVTPNMREVHSAQELIDSLLNAGDNLVVVDFYAPGCGACKSLHPKICQLAEMNPDVEFVKVNYEENKSMCYSLNIHVLPFFQFYRGAQGRLCSFSCTNATIKKFKDALAKHNTPRCSLGPPKGFGEPELLALSKNKSLSLNLPDHVGSSGKEETAFVVGQDRKLEDSAPVGAGRNHEDSAPVKSRHKPEDAALTGALR